MYYVSLGKSKLGFLNPKNWFCISLFSKLIQDHLDHLHQRNPRTQESTWSWAYYAHHYFLFSTWKLGQHDLKMVISITFSQSIPSLLIFCSLIDKVLVDSCWITINLSTSWKQRHCSGHRETCKSCVSQCIVFNNQYTLFHDQLKPSFPWTIHDSVSTDLT